jgi:hypothetical protein
VHIEGSVDLDGDIWIYLYNDDGSDFFPSSSVTVPFRAGLIKKDALMQIPDINNISLTKLLEQREV